MNKGNLVILCGISGSGKSFYAHEKWEENPLTTIVINRDKIRELLYGFTEQTVSNYYSRPDISKLEKQVTHYEDTLIYEALQQEKTVIVDATHLNKAYLQRFEFFNVSIEYKYFDISLGGAIGRDANRNRSVGDKVISKQYNQYLELQRQGIPVKYEPVEFENNSRKRSVWIFDIDGTIAHMTDRSAYDWKRVGEDILDNQVSNIFWALTDNAYFKDHIIFCSGRDETCREETLIWLQKYLGKYNDFDLRMRLQGDNRADWIVKEEVWREIAEDYYIEALIDDRNQVVRRARSLGLKVFQCEYGNF